MHNLCFVASFLPPGSGPAHAIVSNTSMPLCFSPLSKLKNDIPLDMKSSIIQKFHKINQNSQVMTMSPYLKLVASVTPLCLQFFTILEWCILPPLNSQRKSKSVSYSYFRKHSATGNIFFQTPMVNVCHCFIIWHPVPQFRGNLLQNLEKNQY